MSGWMQRLQTLAAKLSRRRDDIRARQYAAAKITRLTGAWIPANQNVNDVIRASSPILRARVRQLIRDFPYFARAANVLVNFTVGTGTNIQSRVLNPRWIPGGDNSGERKIDSITSQKIEDALNWWMDEADASGRLHFSELERLVKRQDIECGEFLVVQTQIRDHARQCPYALAVYEPDYLSAAGATAQGKNELDQGIEYDPATGRVVAYHLADPWGTAKPRRIEARHVLHGFQQLRPGQLRGVSPFVTAVLIARDLSDYLDATLDTTKLAAKYLAIVQSPDIAGFQNMRAIQGQGADSGKKLEQLENAIIEYLRPGEQITFAKPETPGNIFDDFTKFVIRMLAIATDTSYTLLSGDYSDTNYTTLRGERQDLLKMFAPHQHRHVLHFVQPALRAALTSCVLAGRLELPGYFDNPRPYWRFICLPPGLEPIDPIKSANANIADIGAGLASPQEVAARRGRDYEEILDELAEASAMRAERGIQIAGIPADSGSPNIELTDGEDSNDGNNE